MVDQLSLFASDTDPSLGHALVVIPQPRVIPASAAGKAYLRLTQQIQALQEEIREWNTWNQRVRERFAVELPPIHSQYAAVQFALLQVLEERLQNRSLRWGKNQGPQGWDTLAAMAQTLEPWASPTLWAEVQELRDRAITTLETLLAAQKARRKNPKRVDTCAEDIFLWDDEDPKSRGNTPSDDFQQQGESKGDPFANAEADPFETAWEDLWRQAEVQRQQAQKQATARTRENGTIRTLYRRLVSALHPDRESDPQRRLEKTRQLQSIHRAYQTGELWELVETAQALGVADSALFAADTLKTLNRALTQQKQRLEAEKQSLLAELQSQWGIPPWAALSPEILEQRCTQERRAWEERVQATEELLTLLQECPQEAKRILREARELFLEMDADF
ncbi:MAG: J domain-containing protein [Synergistaceae bacterium]